MPGFADGRLWEGFSGSIAFFKLFSDFCFFAFAGGLVADEGFVDIADFPRIGVVVFFVAIFAFVFDDHLLFADIFGATVKGGLEVFFAHRLLFGTQRAATAFFGDL